MVDNFCIKFELLCHFFELPAPMFTHKYAEMRWRRHLDLWPCNSIYAFVAAVWMHQILKWFGCPFFKIMAGFSGLNIVHPNDLNLSPFLTWNEVAS